MFAQIASVLSNFLLLKILTENLSTEQFGYYSLWLSIILFTRQVTYDPISIVAAKEVANSDLGNSKAPIIHQAIAGFSKKAFLFFLPVIIVFALFIYTKIGEIILLFFLIFGFLYVISNGPQGIYINLLNAEGFRKLSSIFISLDGLIKLVLTTALVLMASAKLEGAMIGVALSSFLLFTATRLFISGKNANQLNQLQDKKNTLTNLFISSLPFVIPVAIMAIRSAGDKWFMASFLGVEKLAAYSVLLQLGFLPMTLLVGIFQTYLTPVIYNLAASKNTENRKVLLKLIEKTFIKITLFSAIVTLLSYFLADLFVSIAVGEDYLAFSYLLPAFVAAGAIFGLSNLSNVAAIGLFTSKETGLLMGFSVTLVVLVTALLIYHYDFIGGVIAIFLTSCISLFIYMYALHFWQPSKR